MAHPGAPWLTRDLLRRLTGQFDLGCVRTLNLDASAALDEAARVVPGKAGVPSAKIRGTLVTGCLLECVNVEVLRVRGHELTSFGAVAVLRKLCVLDVRDNQIDKLGELLMVPPPPVDDGLGMTLLSASTAATAGAPLPALQELLCSGNSIGHMKELEALVALPSLRLLSVSEGRGNPCARAGDTAAPRTLLRTLTNVQVLDALPRDVWQCLLDAEESVRARDAAAARVQVGAQASGPWLPPVSGTSSSTVMDPSVVAASTAFEREAAAAHTATARASRCSRW